MLPTIFRSTSCFCLVRACSGRAGAWEEAGKNFEHRNVWSKDYFYMFAAAFGVDLLGYAILFNHFHLILRTRPTLPTRRS